MVPAAAVGDIATRLEGREVLLDSELLVLMCVGLCNPASIRRTGVTQAFTENDFAGLVVLLSSARAVLLCSAVIAEASNHLDRKELSREVLLRELKGRIDAYVETPIGARTIASNEHFLRLGFSDCGLLEAARVKGRTVVTKDRKLYGVLHAAGIDAVNFNDYRWMWLVV